MWRRQPPPWGWRAPPYPPHVGPVHGWPGPPPWMIQTGVVPRLHRVGMEQKPHHRPLDPFAQEEPKEWKAAPVPPSAKAKKPLWESPESPESPWLRE